MELTIELPPSVDSELSEEAKREGISQTEQATLLLHLAHALSSSEHATPFKEAVKEFLASRELDPTIVTSAFEELVRICAAHHDLGKYELSFRVTFKGEAVAVSPPIVNAPTDVDADLILMSWKSPAVHSPLTQRVGRMNRSCLGKYSQLPGSDEDFARAKRLEIEHEVRSQG